MNQNRQLRAEMDHLKKQTQAQNDTLVKQLEINSDLQRDINELKEESSEHSKNINEIQTSDQIKTLRYKILITVTIY